MLLHSVAFLTTATLTGVLAGFVRQEVDLQARDAKPKFSYDKGTSPYCSFWYDNDGSLSCTETLSLFIVSIDNFVRWVSETGVPIISIQPSSGIGYN